jgi:hypothetical protein
MAVQITINQAGKPAGVAGTAREDLATGIKAVLSASGGVFSAYLWEILDAPIDYLGGGASAAGLVTPAAASTDVLPIDMIGTYRVRVSVNSGAGLGATADDVATITFYAGTALAANAYDLPRRVPAFGEQLEHNADQDLLLGAANNKRGWAMELDRWFRVIVSLYNAISAMAILGIWHVEEQAVAADGQTVFDVTDLITVPGLLNVEFIVNGQVQENADYTASNFGGHGRITYAPTGTSPAMRAGWIVQVRYLSV